jgi:hypothetical protein
MTQDFDTAFTAFFEGVKRIASNDPAIRFEADIGSRFIRVVRIEPPNWEGDREHRTLHCFVDRTNGEILRGSWKSPRFTKQSRGNIFDTNNGLGSMKSYGAAYLR